MSIPLDKLYHYIESIAKEICNDIIIYRFYPHGSKNLDNLLPHRSYGYFNMTVNISLYCYDQEPLDYDFYNQHANQHSQKINYILDKYKQDKFKSLNLRQYFNIYDKVLLLHSEVRSNNLEKYINNGYVAVYYWCHAIIAQDWYRFAQYEKLDKNVKQLFLIYNRAWAGTREYRLKFLDLLIKHNLIDFCHTSFNTYDPDSNIHYTQHVYNNNAWEPASNLTEFNLNNSKARSSASADYDIDDYNSTEFEVVLETLFDDDRIQLTEKILRPIALGQPFLLASTHGSLEYLRSYGFKTFDSIIDETYDTIEDPYKRLQAIIESMKQIANWDPTEKTKRMNLIKEITEYNKQYFFSNEFSNIVSSELTINLNLGITEIQKTNTSKSFLDRYKQLSKYHEINNYTLTSATDRKTFAKVIRRARENYRRSLEGK